MNPITRRQVLRGDGGVSVGLPFLFCRQGDTRAATGRVPQRLVTFFYGNGLPRELSADGFSGVLAPLAPHAAKLTMVREIDVTAEGPFGNGHVKGSAGFACGMDFRHPRSKGGPSLDWVAYQASGARTPLPTLSTGVYGADDANERMRIVHSWRGVDRPNEPIPSTLELFDHCFGAPAVGEGRLRRSVLDVVLDDYRRLSGARGGLGPSARAVVSDHLDHLRELERRAISLHKACGRPEDPADLDVLADKTIPHWDRAWPVLVDLFVLALRCDLTRFGNLMVISGGDRFPYDGPAGHLENVHADAYHRWPHQNAGVTRAVVRWTMEKVAHFLTRMDDPAYRDRDGRTLLDNTTVLVGTELGEPASHGRQAMTFFLAGGRFRRGVHAFPGRTDIDLYNTVARRVGVRAPFGDQRHFRGLLPID